MLNKGDKKLEHILKIEEYKPKLQEEGPFKRSELVILAARLLPDYIGQFSDEVPMDTYASAKATRKQRYVLRVPAMLEHPFTLEMFWEGGFFNRWEAHASFDYCPEINKYIFKEYFRKEGNAQTERFLNNAI